MNIQKLMKQAQAMQSNMAQAQEKLAALEVSAEAASGKIIATASGAGMITKLSIDPAIIDPEDAEFLSSLVLKAVQDALIAAKALNEKEMSKLTGGMNLPF